MRTILFKTLCLFTFVFSSLLSQTGPFTVKLRLGNVVTECYPDCPGSEWLVTLSADIFDANNNYVEPSSEIYYSWFQDDCYGVPGFGVVVSGPGPYASVWNPDGLLEKNDPSCCSTCSFQSLLIYVQVTINGQEYDSPIIRIPDEGSGTMSQREVTIDQKRESGSTAGNFGRKIGSSLFHYPAPQTFYRPTTISNEVYRGFQGFVSGTNDKYNRWSDGEEDIPNIVNHKTFSLSAQQQAFTARLQTAYNVTIQTCPAEGGPVPRSVFFKDPWLVDDNTDPLGPRNRGTNALFVSKATSFYPLNDSNTKGVFLNQSSGNVYTLKAHQTIEAVGAVWDFGYWTGTNATLGSPNNIETSVVFTASGAVVTANYDSVLKPLPPTNVSASGSVGNPVHLTWTDNPNTNVTQYQIWRRVKPLGGSEGPPEHIATVNRGVQQYDDYSYVVTESYTDYLLTYDVRSFYSVNSTYSDPNWSATQFGEVGAKLAQSPQGISMSAEEIPTEFAVGSYPNPFNPSTTIRYSLPEPGYVSLKVFDLLGKEIATLVKREHQAGSYQVIFDATGLPSGTYLYRIETGKFSQTQKIVLMK